MTSSITQLALRLSPNAVYKFSNFLFAQPEVEQALIELTESNKDDYLYFSGEAGVGKTHLLIALAEHCQSKGKSALYLSFKELVGSASADILQGLEAHQLVCLDDLNLVVGQRDWEEALFHCFNRLKEAKSQIVIAANVNPASLSFALPDLASRLATGLVLHLDDMSDEQKQLALIEQAKFRGLELDLTTAQYLMRRCGRDMHTLMSVLTDLDKASLREQRRLTIPFIRDSVPEL
jgi:DnaA family protein